MSNRYVNKIIIDHRNHWSDDHKHYLYFLAGIFLKGLWHCRRCNDITADDLVADAWLNYLRKQTKENIKKYSKRAGNQALHRMNYYYYELWKPQCKAQSYFSGVDDGNGCGNDSSNIENMAIVDTADNNREWTHEKVRAELKQQFNSLPKEKLMDKRARVFIKLAYFRGWEHKKIAKYFGLGEKSASTYISRAKATLSKNYEENKI